MIASCMCVVKKTIKMKTNINSTTIKMSNFECSKVTFLCKKLHPCKNTAATIAMQNYAKNGKISNFRHFTRKTEFDPYFVMICLELLIMQCIGISPNFW